MNTQETNGAEPLKQPAPPSGEYRQLDEAARLAGQAKAMMADSINIAVNNERERLLKELSSVRDFFRACATHADRHASVAIDCMDRYIAGGSVASYTRAANHLQSFIANQGGISIK